MSSRGTLVDRSGAEDRGPLSAAPAHTPRRVRLWRSVRGHPIRTVLVLIVAVLLLGGLVLPAVAAVPLLQGRDAVERAQSALGEQDLETGRAELASARNRFRIARVALRNPLVWTARLIPGLGHNLGTAGAVARSGELTALGGIEALDAILALPDGGATLAPRDGVIPTGPIQQVAPALRSAADRIAAAQTQIEGAPDLLLVQPVADARAELRSRLAEVAPGVTAAAALTEQLPAFLGADGPRRYLFGASNPAEARGAGGFIGAFAILEVDDGQLSFTDFEPVQDMPPVPLGELEPPNPDYHARYSRFGSAGFMHNINMTQDFPSAAVALERLYAHVRGDEVDGVILADPFAFAALLEVSGPVDVPGFTTVDADSVVDFVANEAYGQFPSEDERKEVLGAVAASALQGVLHGGGDPARAASALGSAASNGHLLFHSTDPEVQEAFVTAGIHGGIEEAGGGFLSVVMNNAANNKADFYLDRTIRYSAELGPRGKADVHLEVELENSSPTAGLHGHVIGPNAEGLNAGDNRSVVSVLCHCALEGFARDHHGDEEVLTETELGLAAYSSGVRIPSDVTRRLSYELDKPWAWQADEHGEVGTWRLELAQQSLVRPTAVEVEVTVPQGFEILTVSDEGTIRGNTVSFSATTRTDVDLEITFGRPETERFWAAVRRFLGRPLVRL